MAFFFLEHIFFVLVDSEGNRINKIIIYTKKIAAKGYEKSISRQGGFGTVGRSVGP